MPRHTLAAAVLFFSAHACTPPLWAQSAGATSQPTAQAAAPAPTPSAAQELLQQAAQLRPLLTQPASLAFLDAVALLPEPPQRTLFRNADRTLILTPAQAETQTPEVRATLTPRTYEPAFFYSTGYGSPLVYVRMLELAAPHGLATLQGLHTMDFGFGALGHLRTLAYAGATAHGVDVEPVLALLYGEPGDTGPVPPAASAAASASRDASTQLPAGGSAYLHIGRWPADEPIRNAISDAATTKGRQGFDLITAKNTLKEGYIHPKPPAGKTANERQLITLGVDDATFLKATFDALRPGGTFVIYNICPPQSDANDGNAPYIPWADGKSPFTREQFAAAGFEVLAFDADDTAWTLSAFAALGYQGDATDEEFKKQYVTWYTIAKRPDADAKEAKNK